jgi:D-alanine-D-alanine ligase
MVSAKTKILVLAGGNSGEHSISLRSAATVCDALEAAGFEVVMAAISRGGAFLSDDFRPLLARARTELCEVGDTDGVPCALFQDAAGARLVSDTGDTLATVSAVFPVLHGPGGEDGKIQGLLESVGVPFVGAGTAASAMAMDKLAMKYMCDGAGIPQVEFLDACGEDAAALGERIANSFGYPCFVKPANLGSSVGISRVTDAGGIEAALTEARKWDPRVVVERAVDAREIELALLGDTEPEISPPGEIVSPGGFYDFDSKYVDDSAELIAPADLTADTLSALHATARRVWKLVGCSGMARADFFVEKSTGTVLFNELNTIPGFTEISMYPRLWGVAGLALPQLVRRLVELARAEASERLA